MNERYQRQIKEQADKYEELLRSLRQLHGQQLADLQQKLSDKESEMIRTVDALKVEATN